MRKRRNPKTKTASRSFCFHFHSMLPSSFRSVSLFIVALALFGAEVGLGALDDKKDEKKHKEKPYALIFGTVWSPDNRHVHGVKIKCRRSDQKKPHWEQYSDHNGEFAFRVPAGKADYLVSADLKDFKSLEGKKFQAPPEVTVHIENDERTDIGVHLK
jgi:hypothetical protein